MFSDPLVALMLMVMLCFIGMLVMFLFVIRATTNHSHGLRESERRVSLALSEIERQLLDLSYALRQRETGGKTGGSSSSDSIPGLETDADLGALLANISSEDVAQGPMADQHLIPGTGGMGRTGGMEELPDLNGRETSRGKPGAGKSLEIDID